MDCIPAIKWVYIFDEIAVKTSRYEPHTLLSILGTVTQLDFATYTSIVRDQAKATRY